MTLHALRLQIGDEDFFRLLRRWVRRNAGGNVTTAEFIAPAGARTRSGSRAVANALSAMRKARKR